MEPLQTSVQRKAVQSCLPVLSKCLFTVVGLALQNEAHLFSIVLITNACSCVSCRYEYHWADGTNIKKPIKCSAPKYIDYLMTWVQDQLDDETLFPSKIGRIHHLVSFSPHFCQCWIV